MARSRKQPVDTGEPGKYYFDIPDVINIASKRSTALALVETSTPSSGEEAFGKVGPCRLKSSHALHGYTPPDDLVYDLGDWPTQQEVSKYLMKWAIVGFDEGAVVCRRHQNKGRYRFPHQWGIIAITYTQVPLNAVYRPYVVKWFSDMSSEPACAEDLVVIHSALDESIVSDIVEEQGVEVT